MFFISVFEAEKSVSSTLMVIDSSTSASAKGKGDREGEGKKKKPTSMPVAKGKVRLRRSPFSAS